jgi:phage shock protein C
MNRQTSITRSTGDKVIAGVCGGLAQHLGWSATRLRMGYAVLSLLSAAFPGLLVYGVLWYLMPAAPRGETTFRPRRPGE